jgi:hypothetical protein
MPDELALVLEKAFYVKNPLLSTLKQNGRLVPWVGRGDYQYVVDVGATTNNATSVLEDGVLPAENVSVQAVAKFAATTYTVKAHVSIEAQAHGNGVIPKEFVDRSDELANVVEAGLITELEGSLGTGAYGGLTRATYAAWGSRAGAATHSGSYALSQLDTAIETLMTSAAGSRKPVDLNAMEIWCGSTAFFKFSALMKPSTTFISPNSGSGPVVNVDNMGLYGGRELLYNGAVKVVHVPSMTATSVIIGDFSKIVAPEIIPVFSKPIASTNLSDTFALAWRGSLVNLCPSAFYLLTNA